MTRARRSLPADERIQWLGSWPFFAVHGLAVAAPFVTPFGWRWGALAAGSYVLRLVAITAGYHRYFAHRSYETSRAFQLVLAVLGCTAAQKGPLWWAGHHRDHHRFSDLPQDVHSPVQRGFWWSHVGWIVCSKYNEVPYQRMKDFTRYPELVWLDRHHLVPAVTYATLLTLVFGWPGLMWGFFVSTVFTWHGTFLVNSLAHVFGRRRYDTRDDSRNSFAIALVTMGEGWHNNHHHYPSAVRQGWFWWEADVSYGVLRVLALLGVVRNLRLPPAHVVADCAPRAGTAPGSRCSHLRDQLRLSRGCERNAQQDRAGGKRLVKLVGHDAGKLLPIVFRRPASLAEHGLCTTRLAARQTQAET
jgi:stearoyl-CoA desaturase (delta-9 desaturase)